MDQNELENRIKDQLKYQMSGIDSEKDKLSEGSDLYAQMKDDSSLDLENEIKELKELKV